MISNVTLDPHAQYDVLTCAECPLFAFHGKLNVNQAGKNTGGFNISYTKCPSNSDNEPVHTIAAAPLSRIKHMTCHNDCQSTVFAPYKFMCAVNLTELQCLCINVSKSHL